MLFLILTFSLSFSSAMAAGAKWEYVGDKGPSNWPKLFPGCAGARQSPINIESKNVQFGVKSLKPFTVKTLKTKPFPKFTLKNDGHKVEVAFPSDTWQLSFASESVSYCFKPVQMHWHWGSSDSQGSEHLLDGRKYPLELHVVMYNCRLYSDAATAVSSPNGLAVLGIWYKVDDSAASDPLMTRITNEFSKSNIKQCPCQTTDDSKVQIDGFDLSEVLPKDEDKFYRYMGSLTTPPCTENVLWTMYATPRSISSKQMEAFRSLRFPAVGIGKPMVDNFRPPQPLNPAVPVGTIRNVSASFCSASSASPPGLLLVLLCAVSFPKLFAQD